MAAQNVHFKQAVIEEILKLHFKDREKTKVTRDAVKVTTELIRVFVAEGIYRSLDQAQIQGDEEVTLEHFQKILPQLLLDF